MKRIFAYLGVLCVLGLGAYGLNVMRGDENDGFYNSGGGFALAVGSSSLAGAGMGVVLGLIAGLIFGAYNEYGNINDRNQNNAPKPTYLAPE